MQPTEIGGGNGFQIIEIPLNDTCYYYNPNVSPNPKYPTFDIKEYCSNYANLTTDNFALDVSSSYIYIQTKSPLQTIANTHRIEVYSYNATTGILTLKHTFDDNGSLSKNSNPQAVFTGKIKIIVV